jgi:hypothetical protein
MQVTTVAFWFFRSTHVWGVHGVNSSGLPVFNMTVHFLGRDPEFSVAVHRGTQGPVEPNRSNTLTNALGFILREHGALNMTQGDLEIAITFSDASGVRWLRDTRGLLTSVDGDFDFSNVQERLDEREIPMDDDYVNKRDKPLDSYPKPT